MTPLIYEQLGNLSFNIAMEQAKMSPAASLVKAILPDFSSDIPDFEKPRRLLAGASVIPGLSTDVKEEQVDDAGNDALVETQPQQGNVQSAPLAPLPDQAPPDQVPPDQAPPDQALLPDQAERKTHLEENNDTENTAEVQKTVELEKAEVEKSHEPEQAETGFENKAGEPGPADPPQEPHEAQDLAKVAEDGGASAAPTHELAATIPEETHGAGEPATNAVSASGSAGIHGGAGEVETMGDVPTSPAPSFKQPDELEDTTRKRKMPDDDLKKKSKSGKEHKEPKESKKEKKKAKTAEKDTTQRKISAMF